MRELFVVNRRDFIRLTSAAAAGLVVGCRYEPNPLGRGPQGSAAVAGHTPHRLGTYVQIAPSGEVTIWVSKSEMGQGVRTALPMIVAEELDADWGRVSIAQADLDKIWGAMGTGGSSSVREMWMPLRKAGAAARMMLVAAAARRWEVDTSSRALPHSAGRSGRSTRPPRSRSPG